jgi:hypothetical protein
MIYSICIHALREGHAITGARDIIVQYFFVRAESSHEAREVAVKVALMTHLGEWAKVSAISGLGNARRQGYPWAKSDKRTYHALSNGGRTSFHWQTKEGQNGCSFPHLVAKETTAPEAEAVGWNYGEPWFEKHVCELYPAFSREVGVSEPPPTVSVEHPEQTLSDNPLPVASTEDDWRIKALLKRKRDIERGIPLEKCKPLYGQRYTPVAGVVRPKK